MRPVALLLGLAAICLASPLPRANIITSAQLVKIAPNTATCDSPPAPGECMAADMASMWLSLSFITFKIEDFNTRAALTALVLYESANFKYSINHFPGVPGQGTRNMQSTTYNQKYAQYLTSLTDSGITQGAVALATREGPAAVLNLVNTDRWSFASAAWFLTTQCSAEARSGLAEGTEIGWTNYLTGCVGTTATEERNEIWHAAMALPH